MSHFPVCCSQGMEARGQQRMNRGTRKKELLALKALLLSPSPSLMHQGEKLWSSESQAAKPMEDEGRVLYDRVLVDADCTHDGSTRHLSKVAALDTRMYARRQRAVWVYAWTGMARIV